MPKAGIPTVGNSLEQFEESKHAGSKSEDTKVAHSFVLYSLIYYHLKIG